MKCKITLSQRTLNCLTINCYFSLIWVEFGAHLTNRESIDRDTAGGYEFICTATTCDTGICDDLIKAHIAHGCLPTVKESLAEALLGKRIQNIIQAIEIG